MLFIVRINLKYEVEADNKDDVYPKLEADLASINTKASVEFWNNCKIEKKDGNRKD